MTGFDELFAMIEADPAPIIVVAIERLVHERGRPTTETALELRFGSKGSLWIDRATGHWHDWENDVGGGSWKLAVYVGMSADEIAALYGLAPGCKLDPAQLKDLQEAAERRQREYIEATATRRQRRRVEAERLLAGARPARPGDPASRYLLGRRLSDLTGVWYHPAPVITTSRDQKRQLAPSTLFEVTNGRGDLCAVHCVQLDVTTGQRLAGRLAKVSIGNLMDGYVRIGPRAHVVCLGEGAETVASVHAVMPSWRCLAACSSLRIVEQDPDLVDAETVVLLTERGVEDKVRDLGHRMAAAFPIATVSLAHIPAEAVGDKADMNDVLRADPAMVRYALSEHQLERLAVDR